MQREVTLFSLLKSEPSRRLPSHDAQKLGECLKRLVFSMVIRLFKSSLALVAGLALVSCVSLTGARKAVTVTPSPTPWPTLAPVRPAGPTAAVLEVSASRGPQLVERYRVDLQPDVVAVYPLEGWIDQPVRVEVIVLTGDVDPAITIRNVAGDRLAHADMAGPGEPEVIGQFLFPGDGYYELELSSDSDSGQVGVSIYHLDPAGLEAGGVFASIDEQLRGTIEYPTSFHTFRLPVERGRRFDLSAVALTEGLDLLFELYGPDGILLEARDDNVGADPYLWNFMPSRSGIYTIVLSNYDEHVGDYVLRVNPSESGGEASIGRRTELELSALPRRSVWLTLGGMALDGCRIEARPLDAGVDVTVSVYDPYGNRLAGVDLNDPDEPEQLTLVQFPFDGLYQIEFMTVGEGGTIEYYIRPERQADIKMGGRATPGSVPYEGEFVGPGTALAYVFDGQAGDLIGIDAHATGDSDLDLAFDLYSPDGYLLIRRDDVVGKNPVIDHFELPQTGRYTLVLWNYEGSTGPFTLFISRPEAPSTAPSGGGNN